MGYDDVINDLWGTPEVEESPAFVDDKWNALKMAKYFEAEMFKQKWATGFAYVNVIALTSIMKKWKSQGKKASEVQALIDSYMKDDSLRGRNPGWQDFAYRAEEIHAKVAATPPKSRTELLEDAYEIGTLEAFMLAFPDNEAKARKYYEAYKEE